MKNTSLFLSLLVTFGVLNLSFAAPVQKPVNLNCQAAHIDPIFYKATLQGPNKANFYHLKFAYQYYGAVLKYEYDLKKINKSFIGQKARVYNLVAQRNKTVRLYVETEKDGPIDMVCR